VFVRFLLLVFDKTVRQMHGNNAKFYVTTRKLRGKKFLIIPAAKEILENEEDFNQVRNSLLVSRFVMESERIKSLESNFEKMHLLSVGRLEINHFLV